MTEIAQRRGAALEAVMDTVMGLQDRLDGTETEWKV